VGKLAIYKYVSFMFLVMSATLMILTIAGLFGGRTTPTTNHGLAMLVYALPFLFVGNVVMLIYWIVRKRWIWSAMPIFAILSCIPYIGTIYQFRFSSDVDASKAGFKIATYNVAMFGRETSGFKSGDILSEMKKQNVDILCLQEYSDVCGDRRNSDNYREYFPYHAYGKDDMIIYSRFPISQSNTIEFGNYTNNSAMWADVIINEKAFRVYNVHLETTGFNRTLRKVAKMELQGQTITENAIVQAIYGNYTMGMVVRARQCKIVAEDIESCMLPVIVCGDFNDVPYSYTYHTMLGNLVDGFKECGNGFMSTYRGLKKARIDYIFHDKSLSGQTYYKEDLSYSDHHPVFMKIAL
jgi:endonuclease/exonuclease/phosphatase family metal-dependent hydrolase